MKKIYSNNSFVNKFKKPNDKTMAYIKNLKTFNVSHGPVRSAKTTDNIIMYCGEVDESKDIVHLAVGYVQSSAKTILFEGDGLGIKHYPDWQERTELIDNEKVKFRQRVFEGKYDNIDCLIILPKHKSGHPIKYVLAVGGNATSSHEPYKGFSIGMVIATQWELLHKNTRNELLKRTMLSQHRYHFVDMNPTDPNHDVYKQIDRWEKAGTLNYIDKLMEDNPVMTQARIDEIKAEYDPDSIEYQRDIMGMRVSAEGLIYRVRDYNIIPYDSFNASDYVSYVIVADPGENASATGFGVIGITRGWKHIDVIKDYNHRNKGLVGFAVKMPLDYVIDYIEFIKSAKEIMQKAPRDVYSDLDLTFMREYERVKYKHGMHHDLRHAIKDEINDRIKTGLNLLYTGRLRFYDICKATIESYKKAQYDAKQSIKGKYVRYDVPTEGTMIDNIDLVEYAISAYRYELSLYKGD